MTYRVRLSKQALSDLDRLPDFLALKSPAVASRVRDLLVDGIASLAERPNRGRAVGNGTLRELQLKSGRQGYVLRYRVTTSEVLITRIRHTREAR